MSDPEDIIIAMYADYRLWCREWGIPPETWKVYHNIVTEHYDVEKVNPFTVQAVVRINRQRDQLASEVARQMQPIQPNDEDKAVAEVLRMLGGKT